MAITGPKKNKFNHISDPVQKYLLRQEWSMGNGQCPECGGVSQGMADMYINCTPPSVGHEPDCLLALAARQSGLEPVMDSVDD